MVSLTSRSSADPALTGSIDRLVGRFLEHHADGDVEVIRRAGAAAIKAHEGQLRRTGEPYVTHPIAVADIAADLGLDETTITAALLHDAVEDTGITKEWVAKEFGDQVAAVVDGVPSSTVWSSIPRKSNRPPPSARCSSPWPRTGGYC